MKKIKIISLLMLTLLFTGCFSIPGNVDRSGNITPSYSKEIVIECLKGTITISPEETSLGITNINPSKSDPIRSKKQNIVILPKGDHYKYYLEGNHSIVLGVRTLDEEAVFSVSYKNEITEYTIHSLDLMDKFIYLENY